MANYNYLPLFTDAYLGDTLHLSLEEHGAYLKLLMIAWRSNTCDLPDDDDRLAAMLSIPVRKWKKIKTAVFEMWTLNNGRWQQKKLIKIREMVETKRKKRSSAAAERWGAEAHENDNPPTSENSSLQKTEEKVDVFLQDFDAKNFNSEELSHCFYSDRGMQMHCIPNTKDQIPNTKEESKTVSPQVLEECVSVFNAFAEQNGLSKVQSCKGKRLKALRARLKECGGIEGWRAAIEKVSASAFLLGDNPNGWKIDFDFLITASKFTRIMEGVYDRTRKNTSTTIAQSLATALRA